MADEAPNVNLGTGFLTPPPVSNPGPGVQRSTGPLDRNLPWVIELRVTGTLSTMHMQVEDEMLIGRQDVEHDIHPKIDLGQYKAMQLGVSRRHAHIVIRDQKLYLKDLSSTNGTRLNGVPCEPSKEYRLRHGDELMFGQLKLQLNFAVVPAHDGTLIGSGLKQEIKPTADLPQTGKGEQVLIVEEELEVGVVFRLALEQAGFTATLVNDATKALGIVLQKMPDAILMDALLPDMNGLDLVRYLRRHGSNKRVPILVVSGATGGFQMGQAYEAGADAFLGKPVAADELVKTLSEAIEKAKTKLPEVKTGALTPPEITADTKPQVTSASGSTEIAAASVEAGTEAKTADAAVKESPVKPEIPSPPAAEPPSGTVKAGSTEPTPLSAKPIPISLPKIKPLNTTGTKPMTGRGNTQVS